MDIWNDERDLDGLAVYRDEVWYGYEPDALDPADWLIICDSKAEAIAWILRTLRARA